jgi:hypothetical protein
MLSTPQCAASQRSMKCRGSCPTCMSVGVNVKSLALQRLCFVESLSTVLVQSGQQVFAEYPCPALPPFASLCFSFSCTLCRFHGQDSFQSISLAEAKMPNGHAACQSFWHGALKWVGGALQSAKMVTHPSTSAKKKKKRKVRRSEEEVPRLPPPLDWSPAMPAVSQCSKRRRTQGGRR